ncbi:hypothetical protein B0G62_101591 [Paraburkholderia eburnea]|uniref:Uncharacterized protein n=1 Tax=Paraburkholderia eburnea TaxID=1189126 RepID=A0A2S4MN49_9BURK|nr:hypothetical protein B0G62_101591 [Paraburkholderia eburnea]PRZ27321.1 hypothetical protein BX588_101590 [Paraburkholderia eburnea]
MLATRIAKLTCQNRKSLDKFNAFNVSRSHCTRILGAVEITKFGVRITSIDEISDCHA